MPPSFSPRSRRAGRMRLAIPLAFAVLAAACGGGGGNEPGVAVRKVSADISFGLKAGQDKAGGDVTPPVDVDPAVDSDEEITLPPLEISYGKKRTGPSLRFFDTCRNATINDSAAKPATNESTTLPSEGLYRWKRGGEEELTSLPGQKLPISGYEIRAINNVAVQSENTNPATGAKNIVYTYDYSLPNRFSGGYSVITMQVKTAAEVQQEVNVQTGQRARVGDAGRGLSIIRRVDYDRQGNSEEYDYSRSPLLLLPLPVSPGETFRSTAVNQRGLERATYSATVGNRVQIDACGDIVEGWEVKGTLSEPDGSSSQYNIVVATQYGVVLIQEGYEWQNEYGTFKPLFTLGQLNPTTFEDGS